MFLKVRKINFSIYIFWDMVDFALKILNKLGLKDFSEPISEPIEFLQEFNPKQSGAWGRSLR